MTNALQICRICMNVNIKMFTLKNTNVENLYHLLTQVYVDTEDGKPTTVCFLCYARLRQCYRLRQQAIKSNELLEQLLKDGVMEATANSILNNQYTSQDLQISSIYYLNLEPANCQDVYHKADDVMSVKEEEEPIDEGCNVKGFLEEANDSINVDYEAIKSDPEDDQPLIKIVSEKSDGIKDVAHGKERRKRQRKENLYIIQEKGVRNYPNPSNSILIPKIDKTSYKEKKAEQIHMKSGKNLKKNKEKFKKANNNYDDAGVDKEYEISGRKRKRKVLNKQKNQNRDTKTQIINSPQPSVINTISDEFQCNKCGKQFSTKDNLNIHILKCIKKTETSLSASQRKKTDTSKPFLSEMYSCDICTFKTKHELSIVTHLKTHNVTKVLSCNICESRWAYKSDLIRHMKKHSDEKPFSCNICEYKYARKGDLMRHIRKHTDNKPYSCNICEYRSTRRDCLNNHLRTHSL